MNYIDIIILISLLIALWRGFSKGLVLGLFGVLSIFAAIYASLQFSDVLCNYLRENQWSESEYLPLVSFCTIFLAALLVVYLIGKLVHEAVDITVLSFPNKLDGALLGAAKSMLFLALFSVLIDGVNSSRELIPEETLSSSLLFDPLCRAGKWILPFASDSELVRKAGERLPEINLP